MELTKKEIEDSLKLSPKHMAAVKVLERLVRLLRPVWRLGFMRRLISRTTSGRIGMISGYERRGEHDRAADLAIELLIENRHRPRGNVFFPSGRDHWWLLMHSAASNLAKCGDQEKMEEMIELARNYDEPFQGFDVAASFLAFSTWKYREGDYDAAIEFAEIAASADDTWAEPDFRLGWYCLVLGGDAMRHLTRAVSKDHRILSRIENDSECRKHPQIIQELKDLSVDDIVTVRDESDAKDRDDAVD